MDKIYKAGLGLYTVMIGILIPITLLLKAFSFNRDYYPTSFILFIALLVVIFITTCSIQILKNAKPVVKQTLKLTSLIFVSLGVVLQIVVGFDLFKETVSSIGDIIIAVSYIVLTLLGLISLVALHRISVK